jgi:TRAP-type C4-dicarboxylate transport system permease small subunit
MKRILKIEDKIIKLEKAFLVTLVMLMVILSFLQVILRVTAGKSIFWLSPLLRYFVLWAGFLGAALATASQKHFALDIFTRNLKPGAAKIINTVSYIFTSLVCLILMSAAVRFVKSEIDFEVKLFSVGSWQVSAVYMEFMIPLGFALIIFHSLFAILKDFNSPRSLFKRSPLTPPLEKGGKGEYQK